MRAALYFIICFFLFFSEVSSSTELDRLLPIWESAALTCSSNGVDFPSKQTGDPSQPCDDGDMTLFNGLLCAAGDSRGCVGVAEAQDPITGLWHRSPRIRFLGKNDRGNADSSPDMALGIQLYLIQTKDVVRAKKWLLWINDNTPCLMVSNGVCIVEGLPRFCNSADCTIRPLDYANLSATVNYLQDSAGLGVLPDGRLRGLLGTFSGLEEAGKLIDSYVNKPGYSQHLVGVGIYALRKIGRSSIVLHQAETKLMEENPGNAFFSYLAIGAGEKVEREVKARCPANTENLIRPLFQWQWERSSNVGENGLYAWQQSSLWDCIFMARLLGR
ncbi:hypothetical protein [Pseudomonas sp. F01002]|uniref:hypothetical protein n=1 Tax=Pseudomonas sp. F01002 TaxID=2555724 RepID=UPI00106BAFFA|nr:hypothetical protein [Pseudomonas sp. F01002]TFB39020.1 hypothetical protein E3W21_17715 [Pseudomonas sp. F01002]